MLEIERGKDAWLIKTFIAVGKQNALKVLNRSQHEVDYSGACAGRSKETDFSKIRESEGQTYDAPGAKFGHLGPACTFETLLDHYKLDDPALRRLGAIVRAADPKDINHVPEGAGLKAV